MGWTSGGIDLGYTGGIWDEGGGGGGGREPFGGGMDTAFGGSPSPGGSGSWFNAQNVQPFIQGIGALGNAFANNAMMNQYVNAMAAPLPNSALAGMNLDQVGAAMARAEQMSKELASLTPNELTLRSAANAAARNSAAHGVTGNLAAAQGAAAENNATSLWDQWRRGMLLNANQQSSDLAMTREKLLEQQWNRELARRKLNAARQAAMMKGDMDIANALGGIIGAVGGAFMGNPMMGYQMGSQMGNLLGVGMDAGPQTDMGSYTSYNTK